MSAARVLAACERSGVVRDAFCRLGYEAWSNDLEGIEPEGDFLGNHLYGDCFDMIDSYGPFDLLVAHPPCTYLSVSGLHWNTRTPGRKALTDDAVDFVRRLMAAPVGRICIENPVSILSTAIRKPEQIIQPHDFGHDASKATCLWLKDLPPLRTTRYIAPRMVNGRPRWANQTDSGQNRLGPSPGRSTERAKTYAGIAEAMAQQWGPLLTENRGVA